MRPYKKDLNLRKIALAPRHLRKPTFAYLDHVFARSQTQLFVFNRFAIDFTAALVNRTIASDELATSPAALSSAPSGIPSASTLTVTLSISSEFHLWRGG